MRIKVKDLTPYEQDICVVFDGVCNHADYNIEDVDYGHADASICDWVDDIRPTQVCNKCGATYDEWYGEWYDGRID